MALHTHTHIVAHSTYKYQQQAKQKLKTKSNGARSTVFNRQRPSKVYKITKLGSNLMDIYN